MSEQKQSLLQIVADLIYDCGYRGWSKDIREDSDGAHLTIGIPRPNQMGYLVTMTFVDWGGDGEYDLPDLQLTSYGWGEVLKHQAYLSELYKVLSSNPKTGYHTDGGMYNIIPNEGVTLEQGAGAILESIVQMEITADRLSQAIERAKTGILSVLPLDPEVYS